MSEKNSTGPFLLALAIGFFVGMFLMMWAHGALDTKVSIAKISIAKCVVKEDPTRRQTTGVAEYIVEFQDGEYTSVRCANEPIKDK